MKKSYFFVFLAVATISGLAFNRMSKNIELSEYTLNNSHLKNSSGAPSKKTGAPGEGSCVDCHSGSVNDGTPVNNLVMVEDGTTNVVTQYTPGQTYLLTLAINTASTKKGFQTVALQTTNNTQAGTMTAVPGSTATVTFQGRTYVNHTSASNTAPSFSFKWTAPSSDVGDVKFYLASNATNSNSASSGDLIYLSQHTFSVALPTANFTSSATQICAGSSITYNNTSTGSPTSIAWSFPGGNPSTSTLANPTVSYSTAGTYTASLSATNSAGTTTDDNTIIVQEVTTMALGIISNTSACGASDGSVQINGSGTGTISWTGTASGSMSGVSLPAIVPNLAAGSYSFTFNNGTTCPSNTISATVNDAGAPAAPTVTSSDADNILCSGNNLTLTSSAGTDILWSTGETTPSITVTTPGDYFVTYTENGCSASSTITSVSVNDLPATPTVTSSDADNILCSGSSLTLTSSATTGILWSNGATTPSITVTTAGDYFVTLTENTCSSNSAISTISVVSCAGLDENSKKIVIIYPNPTMDVLTVKNLDVNNFSRIQLVDLQGKIIQSWEISKELENINLEHISKGPYLLKIIGKTNSITKAITKF